MRTALVAVVVASLLAGCGGSSHPAPAPRPVPHAAEPYGRLSRAEYAAIVREYALLKPLQTATDVQRAVRAARSACGAGSTPNTRLMVLVRKDCLNALKFFLALGAVEASPSDGTRYSLLALAIQNTVTNAEKINAELLRRGIGGLCARSIGITQGQINSNNDAASAASAAANAAAAGQLRAFLEQQHRLTNALSNEPGGDPLKGIKRGCPQLHAKTGPNGKPRLPAPGDTIKA